MFRHKGPNTPRQILPHKGDLPCGEGIPEPGAEFLFAHTDNFCQREAFRKSESIFPVVLKGLEPPWFAPPGGPFRRTGSGLALRHLGLDYSADGCIMNPQVFGYL